MLCVVELVSSVIMYFLNKYRIYYINPWSASGKITSMSLECTMTKKCLFVLILYNYQTLLQRWRVKEKYTIWQSLQNNLTTDQLRTKSHGLATYSSANQISVCFFFIHLKGITLGWWVLWSYLSFMNLCSIFWIHERNSVSLKKKKT